MLFYFSPCSGLVISGYSKKLYSEDLKDNLLKTQLGNAIIPYKKFKKMYTIDSPGNFKRNQKTSNNLEKSSKKVWQISHPREVIKNPELVTPKKRTKFAIYILGHIWLLLAKICWIWHCKYFAVVCGRRKNSLCQKCLRLDSTKCIFVSKFWIFLSVNLFVEDFPYVFGKD